MPYWWYQCIHMWQWIDNYPVLIMTMWKNYPIILEINYLTADWCKVITKTTSVGYLVSTIKTLEISLKITWWYLPSNAITHMASSYQPKLDGTSELNAEDTTYFQELIGILCLSTEIVCVDVLGDIYILSPYQ